MFETRSRNSVPVGQRLVGGLRARQERPVASGNGNHHEWAIASAEVQSESQSSRWNRRNQGGQHQHISHRSRRSTSTLHHKPRRHRDLPAYSEDRRNEYLTVDEEIPPYNASLHKYLDKLSFDPRIVPVLRINTKLVKSETELHNSITHFSEFNLLPSSTDLWTISHVDDREYEDTIINLIPSEEDVHEDQLYGLSRISSCDSLDRAIIYSILDQDTIAMPQEPPGYNHA